MSRHPNEFFIDQLRNAIANGIYGNAALLPSERKLAADFNVGRSVVRNALRELASEGIVALIPHRGASVINGSSNRAFRRFMFCCRKLSKVPSEMLALLSAVCVAAAAERAEVLVSFSDDYDVQLDVDEVAYRLQQGELQGVMIMEYCPPETVQALYKHSIPFVIINQEADYGGCSCRIDHRAVGRLAGAQLVRSGCAHYGCVSGDLTTLMFKEMLAGFRGALAEEDVIMDRRLVFQLLPTFSEESYRALVEFLRHAPLPLALFAMRDVRAEFVYRACAELNLRIPEDVSVIGYDNLSWSEAAECGLTTIRQPIAQMAAAAVKILKSWSQNNSEPESVIVPCELIKRSSIRNFDSVN